MSVPLKKGRYVWIAKTPPEYAAYFCGCRQKENCGAWVWGNSVAIQDTRGRVLTSSCAVREGVTTWEELHEEFPYLYAEYCGPHPLEGTREVTQDVEVNFTESDIESKAEVKPTPEVKPEKRKYTVKPVEVKPVEVKPVEVKPVEVKPVEVKPVEVKPVEVKPVEVKPAEVKPIEVKPIEVKPAEVKPKPIEVKPKPIEVKPAEVKPAEVKPVEVKPEPIEVETKRILEVSPRKKPQLPQMMRPVLSKPSPLAEDALKNAPEHIRKKFESK